MSPYLGVTFRLCVGLILLVAGVLKLTGLGYEPVVRAGVLSSPYVQFGVIQIELLLGAWLVSGYRPQGATALATFVFAMFMGVSFYFGVVGQSSCGCFGRVHVSPWYVFALDVTVFAGLLLLQFRTGSGAGIRTAALVLGGWCLANAATLGLAYAQFGSLGGALAKLRGEVIAVHETPVAFGEGRTGEKLQSAVTLHNVGDKSVKVIAGTSDCSCLATNDLPVTIAPGGSVTIAVELVLAGKPGVVNRSISFVTDAREQRVVKVPLWASISE